MVSVNYYFVNFNKSPFVLKQVIVQNCRLSASQRVYCYRLQKISLCARRRENGEGVLRLWVTAARELSINRSRGRGKTRAARISFLSPLTRRCTSVLYRCVSEFICPNCRENQNIFTESGQLFDHFCFAETADLGLCNKCSIAKCYENKSVAFLQLFCVPKFNYESNVNNSCPD